MRIRGRRVVLLIAGALPLMAEDDASTPPTFINNSASSLPEAIHVEPETPEGLLPQHPSDSDDQQEGVFGAAESLHDDSVSTLPRLPFNLLQEGDDDDDEESLLLMNASFDLYDKNSIRLASEEASATAKDNSSNLGAPAKEPPDETKEGALQGSPQPTTTNNESESKDEEQPSENQTSNLTSQQQEHNNNATDTTNTTINTTSELTDADISSNQTLSESDNLTDTSSSNSTDSDSESVKNNTSTNTTTNTTTIDEDDEDTIILSERVAVDYASKSAGALILEKSSNFKGTSNLLNGDRDKYAISPCADKKFVVISLSEDILVKQIQLANYELYSSRVKDFQIQISQTMGTHDWVDLGMYTATPGSGVQSIELREPAWGRYLKFKIKSHYGDEFYCTLSQIMVHGSTMVQGFHEHLQESEDEDLMDEDEEEEEEEHQNQQLQQEMPKTTTEGVPEVNNNATADSEHSASSHNLTESAANASEQNSDSPANHESSTEASAADHKGGVNSTQNEGGAVSQGMESSNASSSTSTSTSTSMSLDDSEDDSFSASSSNDDSVDDEDDDEAVHTTYEEHGVHASEDDSSARWQNLMRRKHMHWDGTQKDRNSSDVLPSASIGLSSSNVFSTIIGHLEPLSLHGLGKGLPSALSSSSSDLPFNGILAKASDSTNKIRKVFTVPAILDHLQLSSLNTIGQRQPNAFGSKAAESPEQSLAEKLNSYIRGNDVDRIKVMMAESSTTASSSANASDAPDTKEISKANKKGDPNAAEPIEASHDEVSYEKLHDSDLALAKLLDSLPSVECLKHLDYEDFKKKALAARKGGHRHKGHGGKEHEAAGHAAEPIFKMLTDQIKSLQQNLSVQDQFTKEAVRCYQSVLLDVVVELQTMKMDHDMRLTQLENDLQETKTVRWVFLLYQLVMGLPNWASLFMATFFTSYATPSIISTPLAIVQDFLGKSSLESENLLLSWTFTLCAVLIFVATTWALCQRLLSSIKTSFILKKYSRRRRSAKEAVVSSSAQKGHHSEYSTGSFPASVEMSGEQSTETEAEPLFLSSSRPSSDSLVVEGLSEASRDTSPAPSGLEQAQCSENSSDAASYEVRQVELVESNANEGNNSNPGEGLSPDSSTTKPSETPRSQPAGSIDQHDSGFSSMEKPMQHRTSISVESY